MKMSTPSSLFLAAKGGMFVKLHVNDGCDDGKFYYSIFSGVADESSRTLCCLYFVCFACFVCAYCRR